jgi:hypothetical protein
MSKTADIIMNCLGIVPDRIDYLMEKFGVTWEDLKLDLGSKIKESLNVCNDVPGLEEDIVKAIVMTIGLKVEQELGIKADNVRYYCCYDGITPYRITYKGIWVKDCEELFSVVQSLQIENIAVVASISSQDLFELGYDIRHLTPDIMQEIKNKMTDKYFDNTFYHDLRDACIEVELETWKEEDDAGVC